MRISSLAKGMIFTIGVVALVFIAGGAVFFRSIEALYFAVGVLLSSALNALKVVLLERSVENALEKDSVRAANYLRMQYLLRFVLTGLVLTFAALCPYVNLWGAAAGIFTLPISAFMTKFQKTGVKDSET